MNVPTSAPSAPPYYVFKYVKPNGNRECYENFEFKAAYPHVFRDESKKQYYAFCSLDAFNEYYEAELHTNHVAYFHEVIFNGPQKLKFDVDIKMERIDEYKPNYKFDRDFIAHDTTQYCKNRAINNYVRILIYNIECTLFAAFKGAELPYKILVASASSNSKYSFHIIINGIYVQNVDECNAFYSMLNEKCLLFIDKGVNRKMQNFRLLLSAKLDDPSRIFTPVTQDITTRDDFNAYLIHDIRGCRLLTINCAIQHRTLSGTEQITDAELEKIANALKLIPDFENHRIRGINDNIVNIDRIKPGFCDFCVREHTTDNNLFVAVTETGATLYCRKYNEEHKTQTKLGTCLFKKINTKN